jgi:hypothetical protein
LPLRRQANAPEAALEVEVGLETAQRLQYVSPLDVRLKMLWPHTHAGSHLSGYHLFRTARLLRRRLTTRGAGLIAITAQ